VVNESLGKTEFVVMDKIMQGEYKGEIKIIKKHRKVVPKPEIED